MRVACTVNKPAWMERCFAACKDDRVKTQLAKLLAAGITSMVLCQATLNVFTVLGLAPLTGVGAP